MRSLFFLDTVDTFEFTGHRVFSVFGIWKSNNQPDQTVCGNIKLRLKADNKHSSSQACRKGIIQTKPLVLSLKINMAPPWQCLEDCQRCYNWFNHIALFNTSLHWTLFSLCLEIVCMAWWTPYYHIIIFESTSLASITSQLPVTYTDGNYFPNKPIIETRSNLYLKKL